MHLIHAPAHPDEETAPDEVLLSAFRQHLVRQDLAERTIQDYLHDLKRFRDWLTWVYEGRHLPLAGVCTHELAAFRRYIIHEKNQRPATVNRRVQSLRLFYRFLHQQGVLAENPAEHLRFMRRSARARPKVLRRSEIMALVRAATLSPHGLAARNKAILQLMLQTGLRVSEVARLRRQDIELKARSGTIHVRAGKGMKARELPLNRSARKALETYLNARRRVEPQQPLFQSKRGRVLSTRGIQRVIESLGERAGIDRISVSAHTLRHTFATNYLKSNPGGLVELAGLLGHASLDTTAVYTKPSREDLAEGLERSRLNVFEQ